MARTNTGAGGTPFTGVTTDQVTVLGDGLNNPLTAVTNQTGKGLLKGGAIWSGTGYTFDVSDLYYFIDNQYLSSSAVQITLDPADPTDDRFDIIVVDENGTVSIVKGTPSTPPASPNIQWNQVVVTTVLVSAGSTTPTSITYDLMYNENTGSPTEWTYSAYNLASPLGTIVPNSTTNPFNGSICIEAQGVNIRRGVTLTRGTSVDLQAFSSIQFAFRLDTALGSGTNFNIRFRNSAGTFIGNTVNIFNWGGSKTTTGAYQVFVIPVTAFGNITNVKGFSAILAGGSTAFTYNWSLDFVKLAGSILPQSPTGPIYQSPSNTLYSTDAGYGATTVNGSIFLGKYAGYKASNANYSNFFGEYAGYGATGGVYNSNFLGNNAGYGALDAHDSNFFGYEAGLNGIDSTNSNFFGYQSGKDAMVAYNSNFFGYQSGLEGYNASNSNFFGYNAGFQAGDAFLSTFIGNSAGYQANKANNSIFLGYKAGYLDTVDNSGGIGTSILIGDETSTGGFTRSIAIGKGATNTATNELMIGSTSSPIDTMVVKGTGGIQVPVGTTAERVATQGMIRYNTTTSKFEGYDGTSWSNLN